MVRRSDRRLIAQQHGNGDAASERKCQSLVQIRAQQTIGFRLEVEKQEVLVVAAGDHFCHGPAIRNVTQRQHGEPVAGHVHQQGIEAKCQAAAVQVLRVAATVAGVPRRRRPGTGQMCPGGTACPRSPGPCWPAASPHPAMPPAACAASPRLATTFRVHRSRRSCPWRPSGSRAVGSMVAGAQRGLAIRRLDHNEIANIGGADLTAQLRRPAIFPRQARAHACPARYPSKGRGGTPAPSRAMSVRPSTTKRNVAPARISASTGMAKTSDAGRREAARQQRRQDPASHRQRDDQADDGEQAELGEAGEARQQHGAEAADGGQHAQP